MSKKRFPYLGGIWAGLDFLGLACVCLAGRNAVWKKIKKMTGKPLLKLVGRAGQPPWIQFSHGN